MKPQSLARLRSVGLWVIVILCLGPVILSDLSGGQSHAVWADDDDDDDDDDDRGRGSFRSGGDRNGVASSRRRTQPRVARRQAADLARARPDFAAEIVVTDLSDADLALLIGEGFTVIERKPVVTLATTLDRLAMPIGVSLEAARDRVRQLPSGGDADLNHFYRTTQAEPAPVSAVPCDHGNCTAWEAIGWPASRIASEHCPVTTVIGLVDTGINPDHDIIAGARLHLIPRPGAQVSSSAVHGTAVASLLVGSQTSRVPGLLPNAEVLAVDVFTRVSGDERADVSALVEGLDLLATQQVRLYNLSLSGPPNSVLSRILDRLTDEETLDAIIVSAAGNAGPTALPAWPGAHPRVLAVTAIDSRERLFRQAQRGDHLALAAPGVNVLAATSVQGARAKTGTSFAVPFVTAAAALLMSQPVPQSGLQVRATLAATARDLGTPGRDPMFGFGLVSAAAFCP